MEIFRQEMRIAIARALGRAPADLPGEIEFPPRREMGDLSYSCFALSKEIKRPPQEIASSIAKSLSAPAFVESASAQGPYLNFTLRAADLASGTLPEIERQGDSCGRGSEGAGKTVVIDYSSPNISKHLAFHHIRSTMIGQSLCRLHRARGYRVAGVNHLGDWGTTFGKLMVAVKRLAPPGFLEGASLSGLNDMYVAFHKASEAEPSLEDEARRWFKLLEDGDAEARAMWTRFREISLADFNRVYGRLGVVFDAITGESFFNDRLDSAIKAAVDAGITEVSRGALVVPLGGGMPPAMLRKQDGATLYLTRDIAAALYRRLSYGFDRALYVTDAGQALHFRQLFEVLGKMGFEWASRMEHVPFGVLLMGGQKGKTREGNVVLLENVLDEAVRRTLDLIIEKNPGLEDREEVANAVGIGAVVFNDLKNKRVKDVNFRWEEVLNFEGDAGPYVQYAHVRAHGILRKSGGGDGKASDYSLLREKDEKDLVLLLARFDETVAKAARELEPSVIAQFLLETSAAFHRFHHNLRVIGGDADVSRARAGLVSCTGHVLKAGLGLLGMRAPEKM